MPGESFKTTNHEEIKKWVTERGGKPVHIAGTGVEGDAGVLQIAFPNENLEEISWEEFFKKFDDRGLCFLYQNKLADGSISRFHRFIERE